MPRGRWAWTDRHLKQKVINPHTHTDTQRERGRRRAGRQSETQCNSTLVGPPSLLSCHLPLPFAGAPRLICTKHTHNLAAGGTFLLFCFSLRVFFFHHFCFLRFHIGALRVLVGGRGEGRGLGEGRGTSLALGFVAGIVLVPP